MRWIPTLFILLLAMVSGLYILVNLRKLPRPYFVLFYWLYFVGLMAVLFMPISINGITVKILPPGLGRVNLYELQLSGIEFYENIIMTVPFGFFIKKVFPKFPLILLVILGILIGSSFESMQYVLSHHFLIDRTSDINDVISNAMGVVIGGVMAMIYNLLSKDN